MGLTSFPNGISSFGMPVMGIGEETMTTGNVFFVDSGGGPGSGGGGSDDANAGRSPTNPFLTIDFAIGQCTANNGDIIFVMPGHAENIAATDVAMDVAGVWVRGLGWNASRPTLTFTATGSTVAMSADNCRISNLRLVPGIADVVAAVTMTGDDLIVENCETVSAAVFEFTSFISAGVATNGSDRSKIRNNVFRCLFTAASTTSGILLSGCNDMEITGNHIMGFFAEHVVDGTTAGSVDECLGILIADNYLQNTGSGTDLVIEMDANATGLVISNMMSGEQALDGNYIGGNTRPVNNWMADADDARAVAIPVTSAA